MTNSTYVTVIQDNDPDEDEFHTLFADLAELDPFDVKKEELAAQLAALLSFSKVNRSDFARKSGWSRSRVTNVLNGSKNLTYKTMWEFARHLGYEADMIFRLPNHHMALQPWQTSRPDNTHLETIEGKIANRDSKYARFVINIQSVEEVASDINDGRYSNYYFSLITPDSTGLTRSEHKALSQTSVSIPTSSISFIPEFNIR